MGLRRPRIILARFFAGGCLVVVAVMLATPLVIADGALAIGCSLPCAPPTWSVAVIPDDGTGLLTSDVSGSGGSWPAFFDQLPDRSAPGWWPLPVASSPMPWIFVASASAVLMIVRWRRSSPVMPPAVASTMSAGAR
jgi:hypothetical protein